MSKAREMMTEGAICVRTDESAADAARMMARHGTGALPICGNDRKVKGVVTDRDLVTKVISQGRDPGKFPAGDLNQNEAITVGADDSSDEVMRTMSQHQVRRLPVIDKDRLVGVISMADVAKKLPNPDVGQLVAALSAD